MNSRIKVANTVFKGDQPMARFAQISMAVAVASLLTGCGHLSNASFKPSQFSGATGQQIKLLSFDGLLPAATAELVGGESLQGILTSQCPPAKAATSGPTVLAAPFVVPIVAALGQLAVNQYFTQQQQRIEEIVAASAQAYSLTIQIDPDRLAKTTCLMLVRHSIKADGSIDTVGLQALIKIETVAAGPADTKALKFEPIFVRAQNAVAQTLDSEKPAIAVSVGLSLKAVATSRPDGVARLVPTGEGVVGVANIMLGAASEARCVKSACKSSEVIPFPTNRGLLSLTMSVAEQGITGFNDKAALADLAALKEALGPAVAAAIKAKLED